MVVLFIKLTSLVVVLSVRLSSDRLSINVVAEQLLKPFHLINDVNLRMLAF